MLLLFRTRHKRDSPKYAPNVMRIETNLLFACIFLIEYANYNSIRIKEAIV